MAASPLKFNVTLSAEDLARLSEAQSSPTAQLTVDISVDDLAVAGEHEFQNFLRDRNLQSLEQAIGLTGLVVDFVTSNGHSWPELEFNLCLYLYERYLERGANKDIEEALSRGLKVLENSDDVLQRLHQHYSLAQFFESRFERSSLSTDLAEAISHYQQATLQAIAADRIADALQCLNSLINGLFTQIEVASSEQTICESILTVEALLEARPDIVNAVHNNALRALYYKKYEYTSDLADLRKAVTHGEAATADLSSRHSARSLRLHYLSSVQLILYNRCRDADVLGQAVANAREAAVVNDFDELRYEVMTNLVATLVPLYEQHANIDDLNEAIQVLRDLMKESEDHRSKWAQRAFSLSTCLRYRFRDLGDMSDIDEAISLLAEATEALAFDEYAYMQCRSYHVQTLEKRYAVSEDLNDLVSALKICQISIESTRSVETNDARLKQYRVGALLDMVRLRENRFESEGTVLDLDEAVKYAREATCMALDHPEMCNTLMVLADHLRICYLKCKDIGRLEQALLVSHDAVTSARNTSERAGAWQTISSLYKTKYEATNDVKDLQKYLDAAVSGLSVVGTDNPSMQTALYEQASYAHSRMFRRKGDLTDMHLSIMYATQGSKLAEATPSVPKDVKGVVNITLGIALLVRYDRLNSFTDLDEALDALEIAGKCFHGDQRQMAIVLNNMGNILRRRYKRANWSLGSVKQVVELFTEAIEIALEDDPLLGEYFFNMALALHDKFWFSQQEEDINKAIEYVGRSLDHTDPNDALRPARLFCQANAHVGRYNLLKDLADLDTAISGSRDVVEAARQGDPRSAEQCRDLAEFLEMRFEATGSREDHAAARRMVEEVLATVTAYPQQRVLAGYRAAGWAVADKDFEAAKNALESAIGLLPTVNLRAIERVDQEHLLQDILGLSSLAASVALQLGDPAAHALQLQEAGRGVMNGLAISASSDVTDLEVACPDIATQYKACRDELSLPLTAGLTALDQEGKSSMAAQITNRLEMTRRLERLEMRIRDEIAGFENFQQPLTSDSIRSLAQKGPIVTFNVSRIRSDAILITHSTIRSVPLPDLQLGDLGKYASMLAMKPRLTKGSLRTKCERNKTLLEILEWLWDVAVHPVLKALDIQQASDPTKLPRIWFASSGLMGVLPIHAAGDHTKATSPNLLNFAIPSYTPTLKALAHARQTAWKPLRSSSCEVLLIPTPNLRGHATLTADAEAAAVQEILRETCHTTLLADATKEQILSNLRSANVVHFGCHGQSHPRSPSYSKLILGEDAASWLTVEELQGVRHNRQAQVAYLSACSTAEVSALSLLDEVVHMAAAFQLLGFGQVLGTLWVAKDSEARLVATKFYEGLVGTAESADEGVVARAHHAAVLEARDRNPVDPLTWATFVHFGG